MLAAVVLGLGTLAGCAPVFAPEPPPPCGALVRMCDVSSPPIVDSATVTVDDGTAHPAFTVDDPSRLEALALALVLPHSSPEQVVCDATTTVTLTVEHDAGTDEFVVNSCTSRGRDQALYDWAIDAFDEVSS